MALLEGGGGGGRGDYKRADPDDHGGDGSPCDSLSFDSVLASPNPAQLKQLKVGWMIRVTVWYDKKVPAPVAVVDDDLVGTITGAQSVQLVECIVNGFKFSAQILELKNGTCKVRVMPTPK